ncbi:MAG TPA: CoA transferase [Acetobacteraceae bacterium]|nr:CoA transferase [Acetobacteraceae bacterium]
MPTPLAGKRILDLGALSGSWPHALAISMAAKLCAGYGALVHRPRSPEGEPFALAPPLLPDGRSALDVFLNRGKSLVTGPYDAAIGTPELLAQEAKSIPVKVRISTFAPERDAPATELSLLALSGLLGLVGESGGPPARLAGHQLAYAAGLAANTGLLAALLAGGEEMVDVSLFDVAVSLNWKLPASLLMLGVAPERGNPRNHWVTMPARDGHIALVYQDKDWPALRAMVGDPRLEDACFGSMMSRGQNWKRLIGILEPWFRARTRREITTDAQRRRIPIGPVLFPQELLKDAQYIARGFLLSDGTPQLPLVWDGSRIAWEVSCVA